MNPIISIIIPCYNSEATLGATLNSVMQQEFQDWEALIINDGSTDDTEKISLEWVNKDSKFKYFSKGNEGLGKTRNFGINKAKGIYILPLDSDNLIEKDFTKDAIKAFGNNPEIGVVYGHAEYFGQKTGIWKVDDYQLDKILVHNYIDACAIYKKKIWQDVNGYDENMPYQGHEDWEFWVALGNINVQFQHLNKVTFKYFVSNTSMIRSFTKEMALLNQDYIVKKYSILYHNYFCKSFFKSNNANLIFSKKLKSKKFVIDLFCKTFFGFTCFKSKLDRL
ncbi:glycosyltransferase family 2 protein [Flavobacterium piscisymbiosum]|uniref:Glycosyltransferase family 2 protein n=1 Tax=Flavobacterium piscisymbiosum TaxID=2893753 RepID=A0ABS8M8B5_9FLAO|nr:glycosyltransferase family 2 protein [Flavobacterium sp. F-30]MCC9061723.1 glycosyltransferase family 2 protein [Flavobacterium sp. F-30]